MSETETLAQRIRGEMISAMRAKDKRRLGVIRLIMAAIKQHEVDKRVEVDDPQMLSIPDKMVKQRRDSLTQYDAAGRQDLADQERYELTLLQEFLPAPFTDAELDALIAEVVEAVDAGSMKEMGKVMGRLKPKLQGRADMGDVGQRIKSRLSA